MRTAGERSGSPLNRLNWLHFNSALTTDKGFLQHLVEGVASIETQPCGCVKPLCNCFMAVAYLHPPPFVLRKVSDCPRSNWLCAIFYSPLVYASAPFKTASLYANPPQPT